jgi:type II secretory pathway pseudopilin PulG
MIRAVTRGRDGFPEPAESGFTLVETLIALGIMIVLLAATAGSLNEAMGLNQKTAQMTDMQQNLRAGMNLLVRDFIQTGWNIPTGGLPIPSGTGAGGVRRPGPPDMTYYFSQSDTISAVNPGGGLGPSLNGKATDIVNLLYADNTLALNSHTLDAIANNGTSMTVNASVPISGIPNPIRAGDLIAFSNALGNTVQCVTRVSGQTVYFESGDPFNLNQPAAEQGSIMHLKSGGTFPPTTATRVVMATFYLDTTTNPSVPRLVRRVNFRPGVVVGLVFSDLQLTYDLVDGATNPTNLDNISSPYSPNQIRKANILVSGRSNLKLKNLDDYLWRTLTTQVCLRSLTFVDRYH